MIYVSEIQTTAPRQFLTPLQKVVYETLSERGIPFWRVDTDEAITMEDCVQINERLNAEMVKTLFLCNRQKTAFYLFITKGDKPFSSKEFSASLAIPRVSFAPAEMMDEILGTKIGAATVFSKLLTSAANVQLVLDREILDQEWYPCSDGTTTGYLKIRTADLLENLLSGVDYQEV